jgi:RimJ/RimL family protein N-acetyltransferase/uncharacterized damage-inducible protein DinB
MPTHRSRRTAVTFLPTTRADLPELIALWNDGRVMHWVGFPDGLGYDQDKAVRWLDRLNADPRRRHFIARSADIGFCGELYFAVDPDHRRAGLDIKLRPEAQGGGRAFAALSGLIGHVFEHEPEVDAVWTEPSPTNLAARTLYWSCGLRETTRPADLEQGHPFWHLTRAAWQARSPAVGAGDRGGTRTDGGVSRSTTARDRLVPAGVRVGRTDRKEGIVQRQPWIERRFTFDLPPSLLPNVIERLRGTAARIEERLAGMSAEHLTRRHDDSWSIQENVGHLIEVETLWQGRLDDYDAGVTVLRPADMENQRTFAADYNGRDLNDVLCEFRTRRAKFVARLEQLDQTGAARSAHHPRLDRPMRVIDLALFAAEHDDHHLARITELLASS